MSGYSSFWDDPLHDERQEQRLVRNTEPPAPGYVKLGGQWVEEDKAPGGDELNEMRAADRKRGITPKY